MAEELQGLLDRIHKEGIQKAETEKKELITHAKKEADAILKKANQDAKDIVKKAEEKAIKEEIKAKASIQQAARDIIITLKTELIERIHLCVKNLVAEAMTPKLMSDIISKMADSFAKSSGKKAELSLIFSPKDLDKMAQHFKINLADNLKKQPEILQGHDFGAGLQIGFKGSDVFLDFSDDALTDIISGYVGSRLASILNEK
jgi:V/A-type H+/Na+-transporting ATPase subunit E